MTLTRTASHDATAAAASVAHALNSAEQSVKHTVSGAAEHANQTMHTLAHEVSPALSRMADQVAAMSRQGVHAVQNGGHHISDKVHQASDRTVGYIRHEPVKSVLMAVALGAAVITLVNLISRPHTHR